MKNPEDRLVVAYLAICAASILGYFGILLAEVLTR